MPHEWNDPGARYLRKSWSSTQNSNGFQRQQEYQQQQRRSVNNSFQTGSGKKTMLEPLQNYGSREKFRRQMVKDYKKSLDEQIAHKAYSNDDLVQGNDMKMLEKFINSPQISKTLHFQGLLTGDDKYDQTIDKFVKQDRKRDQTFDPEIYDDDVFKKRDHAYIQKRMVTQMLAKNQEPNIRSNHRLQLREKEFGSKPVAYSKPPNNRYNGSNLMPRQLASRDERLRAPRSSHSQNNKNRLKSSHLLMMSAPDLNVVKQQQQQINNGFKSDNPYQSNAQGKYDHTYENLGSKKKKLLQVSNMMSKAQPFSNFQGY